MVVMATAITACSNSQAEAPPSPPPEVEVTQVVAKSVRQWDEFTGRIAAVGDAVDIAADARTYVDRANGRDPPGEFVPLAHGFGYDLGDFDLGWRRRRGFRLAVAASGYGGGHDHHGNGRKTRTQRRDQIMAIRHKRPPDLQLS